MCTRIDLMKLLGGDLWFWRLKEKQSRCKDTRSVARWLLETFSCLPLLLLLFSTTACCHFVFDFFSWISKAQKEEKAKAAKQQLHLPSYRHYNQMATALPRQHRGWRRGEYGDTEGETGGTVGSGSTRKKRCNFNGFVQDFDQLYMLERN